MKQELESQLKPKEKEPFLLWISNSIVVSLSWGLWAFLFLDFIISIPNDPYGFGKWSINPIYDFLYLRVGGPFLYGNHVITGLMLLSIPVYYSIKNRKLNMATWLSCVFATVFFHEIFLMSGSILAYGWNLVAHQIFSWYMAVLVFFPLIVYAFGNNFQKRMMSRVILVTFIFGVGSQLLYFLFNYHPMTLAQFAPGPQIYSFYPNLFEDIIWLAPIIVWYYEDILFFLQLHLLIKELHPHNYLRYLLFYRNKQVPIKTDLIGKFHYLKEGKEWNKEYLPKDGAKGKTILDVGAGSGETAKFYLDKGAALVVCIEPDPRKFDNLKSNIRDNNWQVIAVKDVLKMEHLASYYDFAKFDCEFGEKILLDFKPSFPFVVEIHSRELMEKFKEKYPEMQIQKKYLLFSTWLGRYH